MDFNECVELFFELNLLEFILAMILFNLGSIADEFLLCLFSLENLSTSKLFFK
jgi:hypothetical protein